MGYKKVVSGLTALAVCLSAAALAGMTPGVSAENNIQNIQIKEYHLDTSYSGGYSSVRFVDDDGNVFEPYDSSEADSSLRYAASLPASYDSREKGYVTPVENQNPFGNCWSYAATHSAASSLLAKGYSTDKSLNLSERHLTWFAHNSEISDKNDRMYGDGVSIGASAFNYGGNWLIAASALSRWNGAIYESECPLESNLSSASCSEELRYKSEYKLSDVNLISSQNRDAAKRAIVENGAVGTGYYNKSDYYAQNDEGTFYYQTEVDNADKGNHAVTVVGWDDNISRDNFGTKPTGDGAWLIKNSWGDGWGDDGYFWMSYYEPSLDVFESYEFVPGGEYDNLYSYNGGMPSMVVNLGSSSVEGGCVYTADGNENVEAVSFFTPEAADYEVNVYTSVPVNGQLSGESASRVTGRVSSYGYHTVNLNSKVAVKAGSKYFVTVKFTSLNSSVASIFVEGSDCYSEEGRSLIVCGGEWTSTSEVKLNDLFIHAITNDAGHKPTTPTNPTNPTTTTKPTNPTNPTTPTTPTTPTAPSTIIYGDADGNGEVDLKDVMVMRKKYANWDVPKFNEKNADCNADGKFDSKDVLLLRKFIAQWDVKLGPQPQK